MVVKFPNGAGHTCGRHAVLSPMKSSPGRFSWGMIAGCPSGWDAGEVFTLAIFLVSAKFVIFLT
jgi:hypothetical protein